MRRRVLDVLLCLAVFIAVVVGAAALGALVGAVIWGQWFVGAGLAWASPPGGLAYRLAGGKRGNLLRCLRRRR